MVKIAVSGVSGSGKTTILNKLFDVLTNNIQSEIIKNKVAHNNTFRAKPVVPTDPSNPVRPTNPDTPNNSGNDNNSGVNDSNSGTNNSNTKDNNSPTNNAVNNIVNGAQILLPNTSLRN